MIRPVRQSEVYEMACKKLNIEKGGAGDSGEVGRKSILVVDDNGQTLRNIKSMLEKDYDISLAPSGANAMTSILSGRSARYASAYRTHHGV